MWQRCNSPCAQAGPAASQGRRPGPALLAAVLLAGAVAAGACSDSRHREQRAQGDTDGDQATGDTGATSAAGPAPDRLDPPAHTAEQNERYRAHLRAGRSLGRDQRWGEAMREFERALEAMPMDGRALTELGWAAFQAGDYDRARAANRDATGASTDAKVRAAALYNLGRVAEALAQTDEAAHYYRSSLELRPSPGVRERLAGLKALAGGAAKPGRTPACPPVPDVELLCECLVTRATKAAAGESERALACNREPRQVPGVELLFVGDRTEERVHLIARSPKGWSPVAELGRVHHPEDSGSHEELEIARFETRMVGERKLLWVEAVQSHTDVDSGSGRTSLRRVRVLTLCSWAPESGELGCALQVPVREEHERPLETKLEAPAAATTTESRTVRRIEVDVRENGVAKVILVEGARIDAVAPLLGERKLW